MTVLTGLTWDHPRGYQPLEACARRWRQLEPDVTVRWERQSLKSFGSDPVDAVAGRYDLVVLDHPFVGTIAEQSRYLPLDRHLDPAVLARIADTVGASQESYRFAGHQWALAIDAAAHVSVRRADVLADGDVPQTWAQVRDTAQGLGPDRFVLALAPIDCMMMLLTVAASLGTPVFAADTVAAADDLAAALELIASLADLAHPGSLRFNPVAVLDAMSAPAGPAYCPALFGYSNFARPPGAARLRFAAVPAGAQGAHGVLGGAGLAVSASSLTPEAAIRFAAFVADPDTQATTYLRAGGQPAHRAAWESGEAQRVAPGYFTDTLAALDRSWIRPRWAGFPSVQETAGDAIHAYLTAGARRDTTALVGHLRSLFECARPRASDGPGKD
jgi:multiple sugar transport system substrate-binding protein